MGEGKVPHPLGPAFYGTKPNDLVQFDYIELGQSRTGEKYIPMVHDDLSGYSWLYRAQTTDTDTAANVLLDWSAAFGVPAGLMSDGSAHFRNETLRLLSKGLCTPHHFALAYCPWANQSVERLGKELLRVARAVLSELQMRHDDLTQLVPIFQSSLNADSPQQNNVPRITAFTGRPASPPISTFLRSIDYKPVSLDESKCLSALNVKKLIQFIEDLYPKVYGHTMEEREHLRKSREKGELANFSEGDYVLVARDEFFEDEKVCLRGPRKVIKALSAYVFTVEDLRNGDKEDVHRTRLKFYSDSSLDEKVILSHVLSSETGMPVSRLFQLVEQDGSLLVAVRWKELSTSYDTMEPFKCVYDDVPNMVLTLLSRTSTPEKLRDKSLATPGL